ncbi:hypothetical protein [Deinococcus hohokamensis]|uniref:Uncharacterized protein n=1 Tax=Deinococcus hohokamensis TaxID=309883 RepID=A0ABV9I805_9DEIO
MSDHSIDHEALWPALPTLPLAWNALPAQGVTLQEGLHLRRSTAPDGTLYLEITLHGSEDFQELLDGRGNYSEEELDDPSTVIEQRWDEAREAMWTVIAEAAETLGRPSQGAEPTPGRVNWHLDDRTITIGLNQADKDCPIEVCVWLLPPGCTPNSLGL